MKSLTRLGSLGALLVCATTGFYAGHRTDSTGNVAAWPPEDPSLIINLAEDLVFVVNQPPMKVVYEVPDDRWLVVTDFTSETSDLETRGREVQESPNRGVELVFYHSGAKGALELIPFRFAREYHSRAGISIPPGSKVAVRIVPPYGQEQIQRVAEAHFMLDAYLVPHR